MKILNLLVLSGGLISQIALAAFSVEELHSASQLAVADFRASNPDHVEHLVGYKTWKSNDEAKVKVYVSHDGMNMEFNYLCHKHDNAVECHAQ